VTLLEKFHAGDIRSLARIISIVENGADGYRELLNRLYGRAGTSLRIGFTGPPGAGKSSLVNAVAHRYLAAGKKVGVIAVDPTSPFTGGALLGDRVRMAEFPSGSSFYFRSMATRGATGGLASATDNVGIVYDSFGFDITLIETVGVGQVEIDVVDLCDTVIVVLVPESGDAVQTMKAGLMEIADVFCVNKSDRPGAERILHELKSTLATRKEVEGAWRIPILPTVATTNENVDKLQLAIDEHIAFIKVQGHFESHRRTQLKKKILNILKNRFQREFIERMTNEMDFDQLLDEIRSGEVSPFEVGDRLYERFGVLEQSSE
jgi:LAO/AO transport system kinase